MLRGNLAADLVLNRRSRSAATRRSSFGPIRLASLPLADLGCESGSCLVWGGNVLTFSARAWPQGQCAWASRQSAPPEPTLADVAGESGGRRARSDCVRREPDFVWARESPWPILFARAAIAPAQRRVETGCAAAQPVFCYYGAVFWGETIREGACRLRRRGALSKA